MRIYGQSWPDRFARDLMVQGAGCQRRRHAYGQARQIPVAEFDMAMLVAKLAGARQRKRKLTGKCEGRKSYAEAMPESSPWQRLCAARAVSAVGRRRPGAAGSRYVWRQTARCSRCQQDDPQLTSAGRALIRAWVHRSRPW
jgi:hypothetical protein